MDIVNIKRRLLCLKRVINKYIKKNRGKTKYKEKWNIEYIKKELNNLEIKTHPFFEDKNIIVDNLTKNIDVDSFIKSTVNDDKTIAIADGILENKIFLMNSLEIIPFQEGIDWNYTHPTSANTYRLYLQCLNIISHLSDAFIKTKKKIYLYKAYFLLLDWIYYIKTDDEKNRFKWVDHTVANRVMNIVYFYSVAKDVIDLNKEIIMKLLIEHGEFLEDDKNYVQNNHGIMVDRSLLLLSVFLVNYSGSKQWFQKAKLRLSNAVYRDFSSKGVHLENSPSYHFMTRRIFNQVENFLKANDLTLGKEIRQQLIKTKDYIKYIVKPNKEIPTIGDTQKGNATWLKKSFDSFCDSHAGITIMQSKADIEENSTWLSFICGYGSKTHKHRDDLSISLYYNGNDILVDSGRYNYDSKDRIRQYFLSPQAHSTLYIPSKDYIIEDPFKNRNKIKTVNYVTNELYDYVKGVNYAYPDVKLSRSVIFFKPNIIVLHDNILSENVDEFQQIFNFASGVTINQVENEKVVLSTKNDTVTLTQVLDGCSVNEYNGDMETPRAIISEEFGEIKKNKQVVFSQSGTSVDFVTVLALGEGMNHLGNIYFDKKNSMLSITIKSEEFRLFI